jgi:hypothetical protein
MADLRQRVKTSMTSESSHGEALKRQSPSFCRPFRGGNFIHDDLYVFQTLYMV